MRAVRSLNAVVDSPACRPQRLAPILCIAMLVAVGAQAQILPQFPTFPPIQFPPIVNLVAGVQGIDLQRFDSSTFGAAGAAGTVTELDANLDPYQTGGQASIVASGGWSPRLESSGEAVGNGSIAANGTVVYFFQVLPLNPQSFPSPIPIPVLLFAAGGGSIAIGSPYVDGSIRAEARVNGSLVGFFGLSVSDGAPAGQTSTFGGAYPLTVTLYDVGAITLELLTGIDEHVLTTGSSSFQAFVDPVVYVDPEATFEHEGETLRYVEHFGVAYSPGVEQWQASIFEDGFESGGVENWSSNK